ncbi:hypothetical protein AERO9AM_11048 [Aeromicrobium sp. 9AM]|nr:hypothetical protein AERO9AM_11048 [Aeromicrobium sp. 9AM]
MTFEGSRHRRVPEGALPASRENQLPTGARFRRLQRISKPVGRLGPAHFLCPAAEPAPLPHDSGPEIQRAE